jgi:CTP synthase
MPSIYQVPLVLEEAGLGDLICERMNIEPTSRDLIDWREWVERLQHPVHSVDVAVVGKYVELPDAYLSVKESLIHAAVANNASVNIHWVHSQDVAAARVEQTFARIDGIVVPGGFGERGFEGKVQAARYARLNNVPYLGLCFGLHVMAVEFARAYFDTEDCNSTELDPETAYPVITLLDEQRRVVDKGGTMRLGSYPCRIVPGTMAREAYGCDEVVERHRHRYEFNKAYEGCLTQAGLTISGKTPDGKFVEIAEITDHPWYLAVQFHPEFKSKPLAPHPLFADFVRASVENRRTRAEGREAPVTVAS